MFQFIQNWLFFIVQAEVTLQSLMLLHIWLYSLLKVCVRRRRHCKELKDINIQILCRKINQKYLIFDFKWNTVFNNLIKK